MQSAEGYILKDRSVICPDCGCVFVTPCMLELPPVTEYDAIEADLHRVLPSPELRAALIAVCPDCDYATWTARCKPSNLNPEFLPESQQIQHSKKFAMAVKCARQKGVNPLDIAFIAINGLYCAREANEDPDLWLELAAYEQNRGMTEEFLIPGEDAQDHLTMAELWRQLGSFDRALAEYEQALGDEFIPGELIEHQKMLANAGDDSLTLLPPWLVRMVFPESAVATAAVEVEKTGRPVPPVILRQSSEQKLGRMPNTPPERRTPLSSSIDDQQHPELLLHKKQEAPTAEASIELAELMAQLETSEVESQDTQQFEEVQPDEATATNNPVMLAASADHAAFEEPGPFVDPGLFEELAAPADLEAAVAPGPQVARISELNADVQISMARVKNSIAMAQGASSISLVQATQVNLIPVGAKLKNGGTLEIVHPPQGATNEIFGGAHNPSGTTASQRVLNKTMRKEKNQRDPHDRLPDIQLTDEEDFGYSYAQNGMQVFVQGGDDLGAQYAAAAPEDAGAQYAAAAAPQQQYAQAAQPQYAQPAQPQYAQPQYAQATQPQYAQPAQPQYAQPAQPQYAQPAQPQYAQPTQQQYAQPAPQQYAQPTQQQYAQPAPQQYAQPAPQQYAQPAEPQYAQAADPQYAQPAQADPQYAQVQSQPAAAAAPAGPTATAPANHADAIAQVESFLSLTRQSSYQSWIRGYRK